MVEKEEKEDDDDFKEQKTQKKDLGVAEEEGLGSYGRRKGGRSDNS